MAEPTVYLTNITDSIFILEGGGCQPNVEHACHDKLVKLVIMVVVVEGVVSVFVCVGGVEDGCVSFVDYARDSHSKTSIFSSVATAPLNYLLYFCFYSCSCW